MLVSDDRQFVFVHIQKTGGMSVEHLLRKHVPDLRQVCGRHEHLRRISPELSEQWQRYFKFAFVRNPWERLVSWYSMIEREHKRLKWWERTFRKKPLRQEIWNHALPYLGDFGEFIRHCTGEVIDDGHLKSFEYNQLDYICGDRGLCDVDFVGRFENLASDMDVVLDRLEIAGGSLPHTNRSAHEHYATYYDASTRAIIEDRFQRDIASFGYEFEGVG